MHTPGPWEFRKAEQDGVWTIFADGSSIMGDAQYYPWVPDNEHDWRLIAAAPELLEALIRMRHWAEGVQVNYTGDHPVAIARAAIAKATGEQQ